MIARQQGRGLAEVAAEAGAEILGGSGLKAALDLNWDEPAELERALGLVLRVLDAVELYQQKIVELEEPTARTKVEANLAVARQVKAHG